MKMELVIVLPPQATRAAIHRGSHTAPRGMDCCPALPGRIRRALLYHGQGQSHWQMPKANFGQPSAAVA